MRANRGIPRDLEGEGKRLNRGQSAFRRKGDVMVQVWKDKRLVRLISTHDATIVNTGRKDKKTNMEIKKPYAIVQYNKFMKGRPVPQLLLNSEEKCTMVKKDGTVSAKLCTLQCILCVQDTHKQKSFLHEVARSWISEVQTTAKSNSDDLQMPEKQTTPRGPKLDPPGRLSGDFRKHKLQKIVAGGKGEKKSTQ